MLHLDYDITNLRGAPYNPRKIDLKDLDTLGQSIKTLGLVKPLIVRGDLLVAGHQRTKALRHIGHTRAAVYVLPCETTTYDEVRFNQLHNGTDMDCGDEECQIHVPLELGYQQVPASTVTGNMRSRMGPVRHEIASLIRKFGPWGGVVATQSGKVIHCGQYALAAIMTNTPLTVYGIADDKVGDYRAFLDKTYGVFSYDGLKRDTWIQTFAQMMRLREGPSGKGNKSTLYETMAIPYLQRSLGKLRAIDFGSGQGDYADRLRKEGFDIHDVELFRRAKGKQALDLGAVNRMIDGMIKRLDKLGQFDVVVCDSVMNSVDSLDAETAVLTTLNLLAKDGGSLFISGRKTERVHSQQQHTSQSGHGRYVEFLDEHGFSALYRKGHWFYQKFHEGPQIELLLADHGFETVQHVRSASSTSWQLHARKVAALPLAQVEKAIAFEFNMPVGDTRRINRHGDVIAAARRLYGQGAMALADA